jgi:serine protease
LLATNQLIVKYKSSAAAFQRPAGADVLQGLSTRAGVSLKYMRTMSGNAHVLRLPQRLPLSQVQVLAARLMTSPDVEYAEPDQLRFAIKDTRAVLPAPVSRPSMLNPNDPLYANQWDMNGTWGINAPAAWSITTGSSSVVVAVIDTGLTNHAEFTGHTVPGYDFISDTQIANDGNGRDSDPSDPGDWVSSDDIASGQFASKCGPENSSWHGTHVAGTIGAIGNNGVGIAGIGWNTMILPVRVLGKCGGYDSDIIDGMRWSAGLAVSGVPTNTHPARVLSLSLGGSGACSTSYQSAINAVNSAGAVVVVAAGNDNLDAGNSTPANCSGVITVAATGASGDKAYYTNYGALVEISAPGGGDSDVGILSTLNTGTQGPLADTYAYYYGTSMATPHVSGVAALLFAVDPALTPAQVLQILRSTSKAFPAGSLCNTSNCGSGIVNAGSAVAYAAALVATSTPSPTWTRTQTPTTTRTSTATLTFTPTFTASLTSTRTQTFTPTRTATASSTPTTTYTPTVTLTPAPTGTRTQTPTPTQTLTASPTSPWTVTPTPTLTLEAASTSTPAATATALVGCNTGPVTIADDGAALPYPSSITLAGLGPWTTHVDVQLLGLTHAWPSDIDVLLVGPQGQNLVLLSDAGGGWSVSNLDLTFDDAATQSLPQDALMASGTYRPTNYGAGDLFPAPAPAPSAAAGLSTFNGTDPNGTWSLYVVDDEPDDAGIMAAGWCLSVSASSDLHATPTPSATASYARTFKSLASQDGWILESRENTNKGGKLNTSAATIQLGDDAANRQYRSILSFDTSALPDKAIIQAAQLKIQQSGAPLGSNPFSVLGSLWADIRLGSFGSSALQLGDFNAVASATTVGAFDPTPSAGWYTDNLGAVGLSKINKVGLTQFRLYFELDDNNNYAADFMRFISGNGPSSSRPLLLVQYSLP